MAGDGVAQVLSGFLKFLFDFQSIEVHALPALGADQQVLVAGCAAENSLALVAVVNAVDQPQIFQFFNGAVNCDQADLRESLPGFIVYFLRGEWTLTAGDDVQDHLPGTRNTSAAAAELALPCLADFRLVFAIYLIENHFQ